MQSGVEAASQAQNLFKSQGILCGFHFRDTVSEVPVVSGVQECNVFRYLVHVKTKVWHLLEIHGGESM